MLKHDNLHSLILEFSQFFAMTISNIIDKLDGIADSQPQGDSTTFIRTKLTQFEPTTVTEIAKSIKKLSIDTCGLSPNPTNL